MTWSNFAEYTAEKLQGLADTYKASISTLITPVYNVVGYGAKGDGVTDDTAAIQAAIDALSTVNSGDLKPGGIVFFPPGAYRYTQIRYKRGTHLMGVGHNSRLIWTSPNPQGGIVANELISGSDGSTLDFRISNLFLSVDTNWTDTNAYPILHLYKCIDFHFVNLWIEGKAKIVTAIQFRQSFQGQIVNLVVDNCYNGIRCDKDTLNFASKTTDFTNTFLYQCQNVSLNLADSSEIEFNGLRIVHDYAWSSGNAVGMYIPSSGSRNKFSNVIIRNVDGYGINIEGGSKNTFVNTEVRESTSSGVVVQGPDNTFVNLLTIGNGSHGLSLQGVNCLRNRFIVLETEDNGGFGINVESDIGTGDNACSLYEVRAYNNISGNGLDNVQAPSISLSRQAQFVRTNSASSFLGGRVAGDSYMRFQVLASGKLEWGPGNAVMDVNLYRAAANVLKTDDQLQTIDGIATKTKAGAITDADFTASPPNGTIAVDTTNSRIYVRVGGVWKYVALT